MRQPHASPVRRARLYPATLLLGALSGLIGTLAHRAGAAGPIPYGLVIAFAMLIVSAWWSRSAAGPVGLGLHLIGSSSLLWLLMGRGPGGDVLIPIGSPAFTGFFDRRAGMIWLIGSLLAQLAVLAIPRSWLSGPGGSPGRPA
ncbi:alcohol dehydrogenase [Bifidobacterium xylocopae]|uniref:Alcohol dehydrogenase n=1 Tax=Bifidobacterium xylocopae TaxID=2493119 RepID=A0A366KC04_9BIFI|nr:alcohol dehydrogenase [Bifidobacterium xylocopae]RBP98772.1 alcohol dehydrogenase [Bifidobacterium xylocopae]